MALGKGDKRLFDWLREREAGEVHSVETVLKVTEWSPSSLRTYLSKNKLAPFLQKTSDGNLKVLLGGDDISEQFFHETFTQSAPRRPTLSPGDELHGANDAFRLTEPLGNGAVGHVWAARRPPDRRSSVAVKVMLPREDLLSQSKVPNVRERFRREAANGVRLDHRNIVKYLDVGEIQGNPFHVMELAEGSVADLVSKESPPDERIVLEIIRCCIAGLGYLHGRGCPHRDIKPPNILKFGDVYKLGDLGIVKWTDFDETFTGGGTITRSSVQLGSWFYMAPEQQQDPHEATFASDIYSLGVTWIELSTGEVPPPQSIGASAFADPSGRKSVSRIIRQMVKYNPEERPTLDEIEASMED